MATRRVLILSILLLHTWLLLAACSDTSKYRVLSFFFDGVPKPGASAPGGEPPPEHTPANDSVVSVQPLEPIRRKVYSHPPYLANRCGACHSAEDGQPFKTAQEGLCRGCHEGVPGDVRYVHGPVNDNACLFCHHYHASAYPKVLLDEPTKLCFRCHDGADLTTGPHHETMERQSCVECHNPHGGNDRFFLVRTDG